jgi:hypothetical protein
MLQLRSISDRLQGVNVKTRKRNVAVPHDPAGFTDSVLKLLDEKCSGIEGTSDKLTAAVKALDGSNLDFSRYGVELFEIFFAGARMGIGTKLADDTKAKIDWNVRLLHLSTTCAKVPYPHPTKPEHQNHMRMVAKLVGCHLEADLRRLRTTRRSRDIRPKRPACRFSRARRRSTTSSHSSRRLQASCAGGRSSSSAWRRC